MHFKKDPFHVFTNLKGIHHFYSLKLLEKSFPGVKTLPISIRIMIEALLRNLDGKKVKEEDIKRLATWKPMGPHEGEVPLVVSRVILQDFTGVPLLVDLAAMRDAAKAQGFDPKKIEPIVPVDLVVDHSVQVDRSGREDAFMFNLALEFERNQERYSFLKWGQEAFKSFKVVPPGIGIVHQVNLEFLAHVVVEEKEGDCLLYPDTLVGTDSHTTMINGLGVLGWGVGGIEAGSAMLGQPVTLATPEVIGVHLSHELQEGVTATDLTLCITELLRKEQVVGKFVEFFGEGVERLTLVDRATIANMAPEYGATMGFFPVDEKTLDYLRLTGRKETQVTLIKEYLTAQGLFGAPKKGEVEFTKTLELDLRTVTPCVSGPKRPQDRIPLTSLKEKFTEMLKLKSEKGGYGKTDFPQVFVRSEGTVNYEEIEGGKAQETTAKSSWSEAEMITNRPLTEPLIDPGYSTFSPHEKVLTHGSIVIAAITSCTNTSNPSVMLAAGLVAKKAVERGMKVNHTIKTSLAPGSRVVTDYLNETKLQPYLDKLGFELVAYGCTTCIGNSGPLDETIENVIKKHDLITASVLSGNRNFEARIHSSVKANFLMSPPLVVIFALAGRVDIDVTQEPIGVDSHGSPVFFKDLWPTSIEIESLIRAHIHPEMFIKRYGNILEDNPLWKEISGGTGAQYAWDVKSTYIQNPPYFEEFSLQLPPKKTVKNMRCLALFGDSVTTDHISPAGAFSSETSAGKYLLEKGVQQKEFNSYGSRRGNHEVMMRGTFANVRVKNQMADGKEGGYTKLQPEGKILPIFDACEIYKEKEIPLIVFAGKDYGMGSSRDWAAKGSSLLGVRAVVAESFERIHRSNLVGMGILPLVFKDPGHLFSIKGDELFTIQGLKEEIIPLQEVTLEIQRKNSVEHIPLLVRIDTKIEVEYYKHGGIMPYVLRELLKD